MSSSVLSEFLNKRVAVITTDGTFLVGVLEGYDHSTNIALRESVKRVLTADGSSTSYDEDIGLFVVRGDCVSVIGKVDARRDARIDWPNTHGKQLPRAR